LCGRLDQRPCGQRYRRRDRPLSRHLDNAVLADEYPDGNGVPSTVKAATGSEAEAIR
jgi:hypothetical protein